ncbi:MAG: molybdopterin-dependent oxidoreductase [Acidimicrobiia bacterium]|nr:molybdopterin-dependent oxidoreductase [Acidimicrobiia bacterium]
MVETHKTFCRFCHVFCGMEVDTEGDRVVAVRGDRDNPITEGYTCQKGRAEVERINHRDRLHRPRARVGDEWVDIEPVQALDEVAGRLTDIVAEHGPDAVATYIGCGGHRTSAGGPWFVRRWMRALGSRQLYTSYTIDSPSLTVAAERFWGGAVPLNLLDVERARCIMFVGTNPAASHQLNIPQSNPSVRIRDAQRAGATLIVVDPRTSDVAHWADIHLPVKPGEDATLLAGMVKVILERDLVDHETVRDHVSGIDRLAEAVAPFDLDYVERRAGVSGRLVEEAAVAFATAETGGVTSGTGMHMAPHHNLTTHLVMTLNGISGRFDRPGGITRNEGPLGRRFDQTMGPVELGTPPMSRVRGISGYNGLFGSYYEMPTNTLTDEILTPGDGQVRALIVNGGNPALVFAEEEATQRALAELDLLVVNDLFMSATAAHADYVFAMKHPFERPDVPKLMDGTYPAPFSQYTDALVDGPAGCLEEWQVFWELAARMELPLKVGDLDARDGTPSSDEVIAAQNRFARVPLDEIRSHPSGAVFGDPHTVAGGVVPNMIGHPDGRMAVGHPEVMAELAEVAAELVPIDAGYDDAGFAFRLITYRMKEVYCTQGHNLPSQHAKAPYNPLLMTADAMGQLGIDDGDAVIVTSDVGEVTAIAERSDNLRDDVVALAFGWGDPSDPRPLTQKGSNVQRLIADHQHHDPVTGLARQSAIPVNVSRR